MDFRKRNAYPHKLLFFSNTNFNKLVIYIGIFVISISYHTQTKSNK